MTLWSCVTRPINCIGAVMTSEAPCLCWTLGFLDSPWYTLEVLCRCSESGPFFVFSVISFPLTLEIILTSTVEVEYISGPLADMSLPSSFLFAMAPSALKAQGQGRRQRRTSKSRLKEKHEMVFHVSMKK